MNFDAPAENAPARQTLTVSELTRRIQERLELEFIDLWVEGEISNLAQPPSGHWYFSLKDDKAQIRAVVWKSAARLIRFKPSDGLKVVVRGSLRLYPPQGSYQIAVELIEPLGKGSLQEAFEQLKETLLREGLFAPERKRVLPALPRRIGIVTSPTGAVIQDILRVLERRFANLDVLLYPARVQGNEAAGEVVQGLRVLGSLGGLDVIIVARGGGSLEDLWPFNEEIVARAIASCPVPTISAVGHETDFTIADFVADVRAPTPSAAAEMVVAAKTDLVARIETLDRRRDASLALRMANLRARVAALAAHRVFEAERGRVRIHAQRVDELTRRAAAALVRRREKRREAWARLSERLEACRIDRQLVARRERMAMAIGRLEHGALRLCERARQSWRHRDERLRSFPWRQSLQERHARLTRRIERMEVLMRASIAERRGALARLAGKIDGLSPLAVLARGYALVWDEARKRLVRRPEDVEIGAALTIRVQGGGLKAKVTAKENT